MKQISWIAGLIVLVVFSGCFDTLEEVTIAENGSVINLKDVQDSMKKLNAAEKKIAATGTLKILVDANEDKMNFTFTFPFSKASEIAGIQGVLKRARQDILDDIMQNIMGEQAGKDEAMLGNEDGDENKDEMGANIDEYYSSVFEKGKFTRKLNKEKYAKVEDDKSLKSLQEMAQLGMAINMKTIINLPKPAKKAEGKGLTLSDDKKKITMEGTLDDFFEDGSYFEYNIEY
jgi:hypothetical protein